MHRLGKYSKRDLKYKTKIGFPRLWLEIRDESTLPGADGSRVLTMLRGKQVRSYIARVRLIRRGVFPLGPTVIATGDLFGLFPVERSIAEEDSLLVYPDDGGCTWISQPTRVCCLEVRHYAGALIR